MPVSVRLSELSPVAPSDLTDGDLLLLTDTEATSSKKLEIGTLRDNFLGALSLGAFTDVDIATTQPEVGDTLIFDGSKFTPGTIDLSPLYEAIGIDPGIRHLGDLNHPLLPDNKTIVEVFEAVGTEIAQAVSTSTNLVNIERQARIEEIESLRLQRVSAMDTEIAARAAADLQLTTNINDVDSRLGEAIESIANLEIDIAPETLNTLNELAAALQDNPDIIANIQQSIVDLDTDYKQADASINSRLINLENKTITLHEIADVSTQVPQIGEVLKWNGTAWAPGIDIDTDTNLDPSDINSLVSQLQNTLNKLVPPAPTTISGLALTAATNAGTARLCKDFIDNANLGYIMAGASVKRNTDSSVSSSTINDFGPGDVGEVNALINGVSVGTANLSNENNGTYDGLQILDYKDASQSTRDSGIQADFYKVIDAKILDAASPDGLNKIEISLGADTSDLDYYYEDSSTPGAPTINASSVYAPTDPNLSYSSGVAHYTEHQDNAWEYSVFIQNASGEMYTDSKLVSTAQTTGFQDPGDIYYTDTGTTNPPAKNHLVGSQAVIDKSQAPRDIHASISSDNQKFSNFTITTPYGSASKRPTTPATINIMGTTARTSGVDEDNILVSNLGTGSGNAYRVGDSIGDNPVPTYSNWDPVAVPADHEAIVRGGVLRWDRTDYSVNHYPHAIDLSNRNLDAQYFEVEFRRSNVSQFTINYTGQAAGCWVAMPGNTAWTTSLAGTNGWADMFQAYRGSGIPTTAEPGCSSGGLMDNDGGSFTCVFGTESSSNDSDNRVLVRWKLTSGQEITSMSFS